MTFFGILREGDPFFLFFAAISLYYAWQGLLIARQLWRRWPAFSSRSLQPADAALADRAAFYVGIPPGVFIHELGHALLVWFYGGTIVDVGYGFYWGYVAHFGFYAPADEWVISMAGTIGSLLYALLIALLWRATNAPGPRFLLLKTLRFQLLFTLIYYPIFTAITAIGDWRTIYDFGRTPQLSLATAVIHTAALFAYWQSERRGFFEQPALAPELAQRLAALGPIEHFDTMPAKQQLDYAHLFLIGGARRRAVRLLQRYRKLHPQSAEGALLLAQAGHWRRTQPSPVEYRLYEEAVALGLPDPMDEALAHIVLATADLERHKPESVQTHLDAALAALSGLEGSEAAQRRATALWQQTLLAQRLGRDAQAREALHAAYENALLARHPGLINLTESELQRIDPGFVPRSSQAIERTSSGP